MLLSCAQEPHNALHHRNGRRLGEGLQRPAGKGRETRLEQLLTPPPVLREEFVSPKLASKLAQQLKVRAAGWVQADT